MSDDVHDILKSKSQMPELCRQPPVGWWCSREAGHKGPCAARAEPVAMHLLHADRVVIAVLASTIKLQEHLKNRPKVLRDLPYETQLAIAGVIDATIDFREPAEERDKRIAIREARSEGLAVGVLERKA